MSAWPLRNLVLRTPRLELRPDDDEGLYELVDVAPRGERLEHVRLRLDAADFVRPEWDVSVEGPR
ncbi:hypothetical protein ACFOWZ_47300 [Lentzea rhizosphaerae]|uniref:Uncharacterized protein n=1 Tax=Lentzea rhizosphaerae TaxID=2041025 RepID=A0ABV8CBK3_9PSEU